MELYAVLRRSGWTSGAELEAAAERSAGAGAAMAGQLRWIRSYVIKECDGARGTVCLYEAVSPDAICEHASLAGLPVDELVEIAGTVVVPSGATVATAPVAGTRSAARIDPLVVARSRC